MSPPVTASTSAEGNRSRRASKTALRSSTWRLPSSAGRSSLRFLSTPMLSTVRCLGRLCASAKATVYVSMSLTGSYLYHSHDHVDRQQALGLYGALIIDPANPADEVEADQDYTIQLQEWLMREGLTYPAMPMDGGQPNYFTINGRAFPSTDMIKMKVGETLKVRFIGSNSGFIHPMHIHGGPFVVVARDGEALAPSARFKADTINVGPGQRYDVVWTALKPGKWMIHCHIPHHTTNNNTEQDGGGGLMMHIEVAGDPTR